MALSTAVFFSVGGTESALAPDAKPIIAAVRQATDASIAFFLIALCTLAFETGAA